MQIRPTCPSGRRDKKNNKTMSWLQNEYKERSKELRAINETCDIIDRGGSMRVTLEAVVEVLPRAMRFPEDACARIYYQGKEYRSHGFKASAAMIRETFQTIDNHKGDITLFYKRGRRSEDFLVEERECVRNIARLVCGYINARIGRRAIDERDAGRLRRRPTGGGIGTMAEEGLSPLQEIFNKHLADKFIYLDMMRYKVKNILFVSTLYDSFILESEDHFFDQFMGGEIYQFSLFSMPRTTAVTSAEQALSQLGRQHYDLVILMLGIDKRLPFALAAEIRRRQGSLPIYLLANRKDDITGLIPMVPQSPHIDKMWVWNGQSRILFSIVKSIEDRANAENDTRVGLVRVILLVEDNPVYYSLMLQTLHTIVFSQIDRTLRDMPHRDNEIERVSRMRSRPKVLHALNYEEAQYLIAQYKDFLLCVITDLEFERAGRTDATAGASLIESVRGQIVGVPMLIASTDKGAREVAQELKVSFLDKRQATFADELSSYVSSQLRFGDFVFRDPRTGNEIARAQSLKDFENIIKYIPAETIKMHSDENQFSLWLMSRGEIELAKRVNPMRFSDYASAEEYKRALLSFFEQYECEQKKGKILDFDQVETLTEKNIVSLFPGAFGGKGRGLAFINLLIYNSDFREFAEEINIRMPVTAIVGTDAYDLFIETVGEKNLKGMPYEKLRQVFVKTPLDERLRSRLSRLLTLCDGPLSVRSSSISEDSLSQPFAGVFDTYVLPNTGDLKTRLEALCDAIRLVYASIFSPSSRGYFEAIGRSIDDEKMAVVIQSLVGSSHENYFYPHFCGTAQSYNYYPVAAQSPEDGVANAAVGLGYYVVGGEKSFRFSPATPEIDAVSTKDLLASTQTDFLALRLDAEKADYIGKGERAAVERLPISMAERHGTLKHCVSVYDPQNDTLSAGLDTAGPRVVNFADILKYGYIPLASLLRSLLNISKEAMGCPIEIEWAVDLDRDEKGRPSFFLVQIKPMVRTHTAIDVTMLKRSKSKTLLTSSNALGNGVIDNIRDIVYVPAEEFNRMETQEMAEEIDYLNSLLLESSTPYILIAPGRWGTRDPFLGIPVTWSQISGARVVVEMSLPGYPLDASLGSHFFHNVTSLGVGYFSIQDSKSEDFLNLAFLNKQEPVEKTKHFRHIRLGENVSVRMDGRNRRAQVIFA